MNLPTLAEQNQKWAGRPQPKGTSRLEKAKEDKKVTVVDERKFKTEVYERDGGRCRWCGRKVTKGIARTPTRGEVHHLHGRIGDLRFESKCAVLLDAECHEKVTGRVNARWVCVATKTWTLKNGEVVTDARAKVKFVRAA